MTLNAALKEIVKNWEQIHDKQNAGYSTPKIVAVWCAKSDIAGSYEVDEEWIGVTPQGSIAWAYASGCSCWSGDFSEERFASMKEVTLDHKHTPEDWEKAIIRFAETKEIQDLPSYNLY